jgi:serine/threonine protein kinase
MLFKLIRSGTFRFDPKYWSGVSEECQDFIKKMLVVDVKARWTADQLLAHPWMASAEASDEHRDDIAYAVCHAFNAKRQWKKAGNAVRATVRMMKARMKLSRKRTVDEAIPTEDGVLLQGRSLLILFCLALACLLAYQTRQENICHHLLPLNSCFLQWP